MKKTLLLLLTTLTLSTYAQKPYTIVRTDRFLEPWRWKHFEELNGEGILNICSDENGLIYFVSRNSLHSYDGMNWKEYKFPDEYGIKGSKANLYSFKSGIIIGGMGNIYQFKNGQYTDFSPPELQKGRNHVNDIIEVDSNYIICALSQGIYVIRNGQKYYYIPEKVASEVDTTFDNLKIIPIDGSLVKETLIKSLAVHKRGKNELIIHTQPGNKGHTITATYSNNIESPLTITGIQKDEKANQYSFTPTKLQTRNKNEYWVISRKVNYPAYRNVDDQTIVYDFENMFSDRNTHSSIVELDDGRIIVAGEGQLYSQEENESWSRYSMPNIPVTSTGYIIMAPTPKGNLWVGGQNGEIFYFKYSYGDMVTIKDIYFQLEENNSSTRWFLTRDNRAVRRQQRDWQYYTQKDGLVEEPIKIIETIDGLICCAGKYKRNSAISIFHKNKWIVFPLPEVNGPIDKRAFYSDNKGNIWIGTSPGYNGMVAKINKQALQYCLEHGKRKGSPFLSKKGDTIPEFEKVSEFGFTSVGIAQGKGGYIYSSNLNQVFRKKGSNIKKVNGVGGKKSCLTSTKSGDIVWLGTEDRGLYKIMGDSMVHFDIDNGLISNVIVDILADSDTTAWVATEKDISRYIHGNWINNCFPKEFNIVKEGGNIKALPNGFLWFNIVPRSWVLKRSTRMKDAIALQEDFFAVRLAPDVSPPNTKIEFFTKKVSAEGNTHIKWTGTDMWNQTERKDLLFAYKLNDSKWSKFENIHDHTFLSLTHGKYTLQVKAMDKYGNIDDSPDSVSFIVMPPIYLRWWFIAMVILFTLVTSFLVSRIIVRNKKLKENNFELQEQKEEILAQNEEIQQQAEELAAQKDSLAEQNEEIITKNEQISKAFKNSELLSELGKQITSELNILSIFDIIYEYVTSIVDTTSFGIGLYDKAVKTIFFDAFMCNGQKEDPFTRSMNQKNSFSVWCIDNQKPVFINDMENEYMNYISEKPTLCGELAVHSSIILPLSVKGKKIGVMVLDSTNKNAYSEADFNNFQSLASYISIALENANSYDTIQAINRNTEKSINYASTIQNAFLPQSVDVNSYIDAFVLFKPKDIVSGDYYWFYPIEQDAEKPTDVIIAAMDCTGHGVPGALMSLVGNNLMREIIIKDKVYDPAEILDKLNKGVKETLKQETTGNNDGMDAAMARIQQQANNTYKITFGGAKNPLVIVHANGSLDMIKGSRYSIGGAKLRKTKVFEQQELRLKKGDQIYLFSDGFSDQNGPDREKFGRDNMLQLLQKNNNQNLTEQRQKLDEALTLHMNSSEQRDDITVIGIKL